MANSRKATETDTMKLTYRRGTCTFTQTDGYLGYVPYGEIASGTTPRNYDALRTLAVRYFAKARRKNRTVLTLCPGHGLPLEAGTLWVSGTLGEVHVNYTWTGSSGTEYVESHIFTIGN